MIELNQDQTVKMSAPCSLIYTDHYSKILSQKAAEK